MTLYTARFHLAESLFNKVHRYKLLLYRMAGEVDSSGAQLGTSASSGQPLNSEASEMADIYKEIDSLHHEIITSLKNDINEKSKLKAL